MEMIIEAATHYADCLCMTDPNYPIGATAIPRTDLNWEYNPTEVTWQ